MRAFELNPGEKKKVDDLGPAYVNVRPAALVDTFIFEHAAKVARGNMFRSGFGLPTFSIEDVEIRVWPTLSKIAFCWGKPIGGRVRVCANIYTYDEKMREQLIERGLIPRTRN